MRGKFSADKKNMNDKIVSAFTNDALGTLDAAGVVEAIATGKISATEANLRRY